MTWLATKTSQLNLWKTPIMGRFHLFRKPTNKKAPWSESASEQYLPSDRRFSAELVPTFADRGRNMVSVTDLYSRILIFLDRSRYIFLQVAPQLYSRGWVDSVPDPLLRRSGSARIRRKPNHIVLVLKKVNIIFPAATKLIWLMLSFPT
jgi:hypothetical protein